MRRIFSPILDLSGQRSCAEDIQFHSAFLTWICFMPRVEIRPELENSFISPRFSLSSSSLIAMSWEQLLYTASKKNILEEIKRGEKMNAFQLHWDLRLVLIPPTLEPFASYHLFMLGLITSFYRAISRLTFQTSLRECQRMVFNWSQ